MNSNPVAVITGSAQRLGCALAQAFHKRGYDLVLHYRNTPINHLLKALNAQRNNSAVAIKADLLDTAAPKQILDAALDAFSRIDLLINNASSFYPTPISKANQEQWDNLFGSNAKAPFFLSQALVPTLKKHSGCIINLADIYAHNPKLQFTLYCMAKAANVMLTKSLALELAPDIRVNGIAPGAALWPEDNIQLDKEKALEKIPLQRIGGTASIVEAALYLAKDESYMTGQILQVDGGKSIIQP